MTPSNRLEASNAISEINYRRIRDINNIDSLIQKEVGQKLAIDLYLTGRAALVGYLPDMTNEVPQVIQYQVNIDQIEKLEELTNSHFFPRHRSGNSFLYDHTLRVVNSIQGYRVIYQCATSIAPNPVKPAQKINLQINQENRGETLSLDFHGRKIRCVSAEQLFLELLFELSESNNPQDLTMILDLLESSNFIAGLFKAKIKELCSVHPQLLFFILQKLDLFLQKANQLQIPISINGHQRLQLILNNQISPDLRPIHEISMVALAQAKSILDQQK